MEEWKIARKKCRKFGKKSSRIRMTVRTSLLVRSVDCAYFLAFLVRVVRRQMWRCYLLLSYGGKRSIDYPAQGNPYNIGSHSCRRAFPHTFHIFFAQFLNLPDYSDFFFFKDVKYGFPVFFRFWRISHIVTERLHIYLEACVELYPNLGNSGKKALG